MAVRALIGATFAAAVGAVALGALGAVVVLWRFVKPKDQVGQLRDQGVL